MGYLKVIGGDKRGFKLVTPKRESLRPTSGRVREALFDILGEKVKEASFLDLFAGTGAVGIEALSRGAERCCFIEMERTHVELIERNLRNCSLEDRSVVLRGRLPQCLIPMPEGPFGTVFLDPPYGSVSIDDLLKRVAEAGVVGPQSWIVLEHRKSLVPPAQVAILRYQRTVRYGDSALSFYRPQIGH